MAEIKAQEWLKNNHEDNKSNVKEIKVEGGINDVELTGEIKFEGYSRLEVVWLAGTKKLEKLIFENCPEISDIDVADNKITEIVGLDGLTKLRKLNCGKNELTEINISKNKQIAELLYHQNPRLKGENIKGLENLTNIIILMGGIASDGIAVDLTLIGKKELEEAAKKLDIDVDKKDIGEIRDLIQERGKRDRENKEKLNHDTTGLPGLLDKSGKVSDDELKKINDKLNEVKQLHDTSKYPDNKEILDSDKFSSEKVKALVEKKKDYDELVEKNKNDLVENGKISQGKIDSLKDANKDALEAIKILGTGLKPEDLDPKLGGAKLSDIPSSTTLKGLLNEKTRLENDSKKLTKKLELIKALTERRVSDQYWKELEAKVEVEVNKLFN